MVNGRDYLITRKSKLKKVSYSGLTIYCSLVFVQPIACNTVLDFLKNVLAFAKTINITVKTLSILGSWQPFTSAILCSSDD